MKRVTRWWMSLTLLLGLGGGCAMSQTDEIKLGRQTHGKFESEFGGLYPDQDMQRYVHAVGMDVARYAGRPDLDWKFRVLNSDQINAFAVPGGYIYITQGLLFRLRNEAQLAGVLAHEAGHIEHRHSVQQIQRAQWARGGALLAGIFGGSTVGDVAGVVAGLTLMKYSRDQERQADMSGLKYLARAGYNPRGIVQTMQVLQENSRGAPPEFFSSHPNPGNRQEYLTETIARRYRAAGEEGRYGGEAFRENVLDRRRSALVPADFHGCPACGAVAALNHGR